jgi:two-component system, NtrC family, nitrogen regulation response regulator NtrX
MLQSYAWPGNVRELRNVMERMMIMVDGANITPENLPPGMRRPREQEAPAPAPAALSIGNDFESLKEARDAFESEFIRRKLAENDGNVSRTAEALDIQRSHLYRKLRAHGIEVDRRDGERKER